ncbi:RNA-directed DNA polymerase [Aeromicrobium fastidiosum]|uniref:RNA-directed DNA polymerase n=1 Tax=Aeromicrobium fastidiosum TaxID=52699 RepID=UPI00202364F1|nr:RNA-directed DNA polymerase [Aeromicrobium fastidiosum]MCL8251365.1 RNA-directed DNA polymerase [Aeromicrobium fastidiosum]
MKPAVDAALAPGVCGYRFGAEAGLSYSSEHRRFQQFAKGEAEGAGFVVIADVAKFFRGSSWTVVLDSVDRLVGGKASTSELNEFARSAERSGLNHLPAGYADARFLSNVVLSATDELIPNSFARWVDDYRIFVDTEDEAATAVESLQVGLRTAGLSLNAAKLRVIPASLFPTMKGVPLESVYHPEVESAEDVRSSLRSVFWNAASDPTANRRSIRFVLPRLAEQRDDVAVDWALAVLPQMPWEAPRICSYLAAFVNAEVSASVERQLIGALETKSTWTATRLSALAATAGVSKSAANVIAEAMKSVRSPALWSLLLRSLSLSGHSTEVHQVVSRGVTDPRGALAALRDIDADDSFLDQTNLLPTREALAAGPAPAPVTDSIL